MYMKKNPKITIVTPTYNSGQYLENCILSIKNQTYQNFEHIIVDGGSNDNTLEILKKYGGTYPMKWISEPDNGMYDAINKGFDMAEGTIYAWLNSDDFYFPWALQVVAKAFEKKEIHWLIGMPSNTKIFGENEISYLMPNLPTVFCRSMIEKGVYDGRQMYFIQQESCFWSDELWKKCGGINSSYKLAGDYFLWKSFAKETSLYTVHCNLASFRIHEGQKSSNIREYYKEINRKKHSKLVNMLTLFGLHIYSLATYNRYVINLSEIFGSE